MPLARWTGTGLWLDAMVEAGPFCAGDTAFDPEAPTLQYGETWSQGDLTCTSASTGLTCADAVGNGFTLARAGWELLGQEAAAAAAFGELRHVIRTEARHDRPGEVVRVQAPELVGGMGCGGLQEAAVTVEFDRPPSGALHFACYIFEDWLIESGPLYGE
jgi:hypothetical protein